MREFQSHRLGVVLLCLALSACGSQLTDAELRAGAQVGVTNADVPADSAAAPEGATSDTLESGAAAEATGGSDPGSGQTLSGPDGTAPESADGSQEGQATEVKAGKGGRPIVIGNVGSTSGVIGDVASLELQGLRVWVKHVNDNGGINGRPIRLLTADDGTDAQRHQALVQQMVETNKVIALVGNGNTFTLTRATLDYLERKKVPLVGGDGVNVLSDQSPMSFPSHTAGSVLVPANYMATARAAKFAGSKKAGLVTCVEVSNCNTAYNTFDEGMRKVGLEPVYKAQGQITQADYTSECLGARNAGAAVIYVASDGGTVSRLAASCVRQNYRPIIVWNATAELKTHERDPNLEGAVIGSATFQWFEGGSPPRDEFRAAMARYLPGEKITAGHGVGWMDGQLFGKALAASSGEPGPQQVLEGLWTIRNDTFGGLTGPLTFVKGKNPRPPVCMFIVRIVNGKYTSPDGPKPLCS